MNEEKTLFKGCSSPVVNLGSFLLSGAVFAGAMGGSFFTVAPVNAILWAVAVAALAYAGARWLLLRFRVYEVTTERIRMTSGIVTRRSDEMELYRVKDLTLVEPLVARMLGCGDIVVTTNDASTPTLELKCLAGARELREQLRQSVEVCRDRKRVRLAELE